MNLESSPVGHQRPTLLVLDPPDISAWARAPAPSLLGEPPGPRLSAARSLTALLVVIVALAAAGYVVFVRPGSAPVVNRTAPTYSPYVDVTLTPTYAFEDPTANPVGGVVLGFVVAAPGAAPCTPSWGGAYSLAQAGTTLDLDRRIEQMAKQGGHAMVSFGGQANTELAVGCTDTQSLTRAYASVVDRYDVRNVDFDVEGAALANAAANDRRARAVAALERSEAARHRPLQIWLTLPVGTDGFTPAGLDAIGSMLRAHVTLAGVNAMAMDFAPTATVKRDMLGATTRALIAAHTQLDALTRTEGQTLTSAQLWARLGATVMIGRNDVDGEVFTLADARGLTRFAGLHHLSRVSTWSVNRDAQCGRVFAQIAVLSNTCSGVKQPALAFTKVFMRLPGTKTADAQALREGAVPQVVASPNDDPATSPYPIWSSGAPYGAGYKVVWHHDVYQAKWYNQNQSPDGGAAQAAQTPWLLLGPVRATDTPMKLIVSGRRGLPTWSGSRIYRAGDQVLYGGLPFEARWYIKTTTIPSTILPADPAQPWKPLFRAPGEPQAPADPNGAR